MKKWLKNSLFVLLLSTLLLGCGKAADKGNEIEVVTTIGMITDVVKNVGGKHVNVEGLMGAGVDPHLYRASESDVRKLAAADIIFYNGLHLESKMIDIFEKMGREKLTVAVSRTVDKSKLHKPAEYEGYFDPHIWFDIALWAQTVDVIKEALIENKPELKQDFEKNATKFKRELEKLHTWVKIEVESLPKSQRVLVTAHDAFGYFGSAYGFEVMGLQGLSTESEAGTKDVQLLATTIAKRKIPAIFIESSIPKRNVEAVQAAVRAKGWDVKIGGELFSDAMGEPGTEEGTFIGMVKHNVNTIVGALKGETHEH